VAIGFAFVAGWKLARLSARCRMGVVLSGLLLMTAGAIYAWMLWDAQPLPIESARLQPHAKYARPPRALVLQATKDPEFGQAADWPRGGAVSQEGEPSAQWLKEHASEIRANWKELLPVRDWVKRVNSFDGFDDYAETITAPILDFQPLRQFDLASKNMALLLGSEGHGDEAGPILADLLIFGRHLRGGSRALVTLMIGVVCEKEALRTLDALVLRDELPPASRKMLAEALRPSTDEWDDLERSLRNEVSFAGKLLPREEPRGRFVETWIPRPLLVLGFNRNSTLRLYSDYMINLSDLARAGNIAQVRAVEQQHQEAMNRLHLKNYVGRLYFDLFPPQIAKVAEKLKELRGERARLALVVGK